MNLHLLSCRRPTASRKNSQPRAKHIAVLWKDIKMDYIQLIRQLPPPTEEQSRAFAEYVSNAHSWYKHLPLYPAVPFYFYLDPNAGRKIVDTTPETQVFADITNPKECFHYATLLTADYRTRFGFWDYCHDFDNAFYYRNSQGVMSTESPAGSYVDSATNQLGLGVYGAEGGWHALPARLVETGQVALTALVHPLQSFSLSWVTSPDEGRMGYPYYLWMANSGVSPALVQALKAWHEASYGDEAEAERKVIKSQHKERGSLERYQLWQATESGHRAGICGKHLDQLAAQARQQQLSDIEATLNRVGVAIYGQAYAR